jgi:Fe-S cluster assembly iron-binding protein IscA
MALDEPNQEDTIVDQGGYRLLVDPRTSDIVQQSGGLVIDFVNEQQQRGYLLRLNTKGDGCGGGCSSCE